MSAERRYRRVEELEGEQRAAASAEGNAVVAAGAGSGKTTVLAARYVRLLETGRTASGERVHARNVLVLTFTRKAAAEMYSRIYGALAEAAALAAPSDAELAAHLAACLAEFSQSQISTFDSFAAKVARSGSSRFGIAPDFAVDEDGARELAGELALSFLLEHREEEAIRDLVSAAGLEGARDDCLAELAIRRMSISSPPDFAAFHARQSERLEEMAAAGREALLAMRAAVADYAGIKTTSTSEAWIQAFAADPGASEGELLGFIAGFESLRKPGSNSKDECSQFLSDSVPAMKKAASSYRAIAATRSAHPGRLALYRLLDEFRARWDTLRRVQKTLTFRDVARLALDVLGSDPEVLRHYRGLYSHVMIDEFQDDDELQKDVLLLLAGGEPKLYFVGDEKQSIYLFRGADVSVFRALAGELRSPDPSMPGTALSLSRNYRSEPGVIDMINAIFPAVMAPGEGFDTLAPFEARFEPLESRPPTPGVEPRFVYLELPRPDQGPEGHRDAGVAREAAEAEAWEIARIVREAVEGGGLLVADRKAGAARPARYEDFAVLLRSTGNQVHFEKYFRLFDVPYGSENACGLFSEAVACDLYYALRLALYPADRNALAAYLRSPFAGLSDEALVRVLSAFGDSVGGGELPAPEPLLPLPDRAGWARGASTLAALRSMIDRAPIATALSFLWFEAGYRSALLRDPVASAFEEHFELVHTLAVRADARGECLASFVASLEGLVGKPDKLELELPRDSARGVRIMTVHKSKGLEFPIVIVPQANNVGQDRGARDSWYWEEGLGPTFKPPAALGSRSRNAFFEHAKETRAAMEGAELKRLLYVALTRAESHIVVTATEPRSEDAKGRSFRSLLAAPLGLFDEPPAPARALAPFGALASLPSGALVGAIPERSDVEYYQLVAGAKGRRRVGDGGAAYAALPLVERPTLPLSASISSIAERYAERYAGAVPPQAESLDIPSGLAPPEGLPGDAWGSLVHAVLEARLKPRGRGLILPPSLEAALEASLRGASAIAKAKEAAARLAQVFLDSELGRRALAAEERYVELKFALALDRGEDSRTPMRARGSIDLAFVEGTRVVVVDYKTDLAMAAGAHDMQVAAYKRAAAAIFELPAEAWVFYLYGGGRAVAVDADGTSPRLEEAPEQSPGPSPSFGNS